MICSRKYSISYVKVFLSFSVFTFFVILILLGLIKADIISHDSPTQDTYSNDKYYKLIIYGSPVNIPYNNEFIPIEDFITYQEDSNGITWNTLDGKSLRFDFTKADTETYNDLIQQKATAISIGKRGSQLNIINNKIKSIQLTPNYDIILEKKRSSLDYNISSDTSNTDNFIITTSSDDDIIYNDKNIEWNGFKFDFSDAIDKQNLNVSLDSDNNQIILSGDNISLIDPTITYNGTYLSGAKNKYCNFGTCTNNNYTRIGSSYNDYIFFNLSNVENKGYILLNATLNLTVDGGQTAYNCPLNIITSSWSDSDNIIPTTTNIIQNISLPGTISNGVIESFNVTNLINYFINGTYIDYGFLFNGTYASSSNTNTFGSFIEIPDSYKPTLTITYLADIISPNVTIVTPLNNTNSSNINLNINFTANDTNLAYCWYSNDSYNVNTSITCGQNITTITWKQGNHNLTIWANDTFGNINSSEVSFFIDNIGPVISNLNPPNASQFNVATNIKINFTRVDSGIGMSSCWWANSSLVNNSLTTGQNITVNESGNGNYNLKIWCNDTLNNINSYQYFYSISTTAPAITKYNPLTGTYFNYKNVFFNFTATDGLGLSVCRLYGDFNGTYVINYTWINPTSGVMNYTNLSLNDGTYKWNIWCNNTGGNGQFGTSNNTFTVDTIYPTINITQLTPTQGSQTFTFNTTINDTNLASCKYSITNTSGSIDGLNNNISFTCNQLTSATTSQYGNFILITYAIDYAGNENSTNLSFTTSASSGFTISGSGGGTQENKSQVIAIIQLNYTTKSDLNRAILYSTIRYFCNDTKCNKYDSISILKNLSNNGIVIREDELQDWIDYYNDNKLEVVFIKYSDVIYYNLFQGVTEVIGQKFLITPSRLDVFAIIIFGKEFTYSLSSNKVLKNVSISGDLGLSINETSQTTSEIKLNVFNSDFFAKSFVGIANFVSLDGNSNFVNVTVRVINIKDNLVIIILGLIILIVIYFIVKNWRKNGKKNNIF